MARKRIVLTAKKKAAPGICNAVVNGEVCSEPAKVRGLCNRHYRYCLKHDLLDQIGLPPLTEHPTKNKYEPKPEEMRVDGICTAIVNGVPCQEIANRRGLCQRHYMGIHQQDRTLLPLFFVDKRTSLRIQSNPPKGTCRIIEHNTKCTAKVHARGLCKKHYEWLKTQGTEMLDRYGLEVPGKRIYSLRKDPQPGRCRVSENGHGCGERAVIRGLCRSHYNILHKKVIFEDIALPKKQALVLERNPNPAPDSCVIMENGKPCSAPREHRGICSYHRQKILNAPHFSMDELADPIVRDDQPFMVSPFLIAGTCRAIEDGIPCGLPTHVRGLCRKHYRKAMKYGFIDQVSSVFSDLNHWYLDKNVLFDFADAMCFQVKMQAASIQVIDSIHRGRLRASISADAVKSTYNHVRYRLNRPSSDGGRGTPIEEADMQARQFIKELLLDQAQHWQIIALPAGHLMQEIDISGTLSLEDAWEWRSFQYARRLPDPPSLFITRDSDFPLGTHPHDAVNLLTPT